MTKDKYSAVWVSHSSIRDFLQCPRAYFLRNVYKDPKTGRKITLMKPPLALGQAVHEVIEALSALPAEERFKKSLIERFDQIWEKVSGKKGGFLDADSENKYKERGRAMLARVVKNPDPLSGLAVKIKMELPYFWLSEKDNIILCGKIDWLEYLPDTNSVHIIDFKTGQADEDPDSLQLPIYHLLARNCQERGVSKVSYWYLDRSDKPIEAPLPDPEESYKRVLETAKQVKLARQLERYKCPQGKKGCFACQPLEAILRGEAELVGRDAYRQDVYILGSSTNEGKKSSLLH